MSATDVAAELEQLVGERHVLSGVQATPYDSDGTASRGLRGKPDAVVLPGSPEQVAAVVRWSHEQGMPLVPRGGGTGLAGGAVPVHGGVVVGLERLSRVHEMAPEEWRMRVGAGLSTATVRRLARENGLFFPPDPGAAEQSQIGGNVATNAGGPHAFKYGATGAWVTGLEVVIPPGRIVRLGGDLRKDVGGYDVKSLMIGSEGTLGVITAVSLRLLPAPPVVLPVVAFFGSVEAGVRTAADVIGSGLRPATLDYIDKPALEIVAAAYPGSVPVGVRFVLLCEVDGPHEEARRECAELKDLLSADALDIQEPRPAELWRWRDGVSGAVASSRGGKVSEDIVVPLARLAEAIGRIHSIGRDLGIPTCTWGHAGDGNIHASFIIDQSDGAELRAANGATGRLFALASELGGCVTGEHGIGYLKRGQLALQWGDAEIELHERIKQTFDPRGLLNPGKKVARTAPGD